MKSSFYYWTHLDQIKEYQLIRQIAGYYREYDKTEKRREWNKIRRKKYHYRYKAPPNKKKEAMELLGGKCKKCNLNDIRFLCIDHVNNNGKKHRQIIKNTNLMYKWVVKNHPNFGEYPVQLLCFHCNGTKPKK